MPHPVLLATRVVVVLLAFATALAAQSAPQNVLFTWQGDTATTLTVNFQSFGKAPLDATVFWDVVPRDGIVGDYRFRVKGSTRTIEGLPERWFHRVELTGLPPATSVYLVVGHAVHGVSREHHVRTLPDDARPLRFVTGGDMGPGAEARTLLRQAARTAPDFVLLGGDIAYANGDVAAVGHWDSWLSYWCEEMVTPDGRSVPLALAIGNHEVRGGYGQPAAHAPFFFTLFAQDERSYHLRRFGSELVVWLLDSGHTASHGGEQAQWLERTLQEHAAVRHKVAVYHIPLWPSHRDEFDDLSVAGREHWAPSFERHRLSVAFENHDHTFKVSRRIRGGRVDPDGVLYLGDGCFGRAPRAVTYGGRWYLQHQGSVQHFWCVDVAADGLDCRAIDLRGRVFHHEPDHGAAARAAAEVRAGLAPIWQLPADSLKLTPFVPAVAGGEPGDDPRSEAELSFSNHLEVAAAVEVALVAAPAGLRLAHTPWRADGRALDAGGLPPGRTMATRLALVGPLEQIDRRTRLLVTVRGRTVDGREIVIEERLSLPRRR